MRFWRLPIIKPAMTQATIIAAGIKHNRRQEKHYQNHDDVSDPLGSVPMEQRRSISEFCSFDPPGREAIKDRRHQQNRHCQNRLLRVAETTPRLLSRRLFKLHFQPVGLEFAIMLRVGAGRVRSNALASDNAPSRLGCFWIRR